MALHVDIAVTQSINSRRRGNSNMRFTWIVVGVKVSVENWFTTDLIDGSMTIWCRMSETVAVEQHCSHQLLTSSTAQLWGMVQQFITVLAYHDLHPDVKWISEQLLKIVAVEAYINEIEAYINGSIRSSRSIHKWYGMMQHGMLQSVTVKRGLRLCWCKVEQIWE